MQRKSKFLLSVFIAIGVFVLILRLHTISPARFSNSNETALWGEERLISIATGRMRQISYRWGDVVSDTEVETPFSRLLKKSGVKLSIPDEEEKDWMIFSSSSFLNSLSPNYSKGANAVYCGDFATSYLMVFDVPLERQQAIVQNFYLLFTERKFDFAMNYLRDVLEANDVQDPAKRGQARKKK